MSTRTRWYVLPLKGVRPKDRRIQILEVGTDDLVAEMGGTSKKDVRRALLTCRAPEMLSLLQDVVSPDGRLRIGPELAEKIRDFLRSYTDSLKTTEEP